MSKINPFFDHYAHLRTFPDQVLRDLARNECAPRDYRKHATEILIVRESPFAEHEDLREFYIELKAELDGIVFEHPAPEEKPETSGPLQASVTTKTMFGGDVVDMEALRKLASPEPKSTFTGFDFEIPTPAPAVSTKPKKKKDKPDESTG